MEFKEKIGMDIKYLQGWKVNQRVPCINIVDYSTSLQIMAPIFNRESAEVTKGVFRDSWIAWAGPPKVLEIDSSSSNLSDALGDFCEAHGIDMQHIAADAHWQLGKVERHGHWFSQIFERVADECRPTTAEEFVACVMQTQTAKNTLISESGASPYQLVFGRNPRIPHGSFTASDAVLADAGYQRFQAVRQSARLAVLQCQDSKALRLALRARPKPRREFVSGDWVYYWRSQKWQNGVLLRGGRWHGAGLILGGVPGLDSEDVIEVTGNVYGSNDAPFNWWHTFDAEVAKVASTLASEAQAYSTATAVCEWMSLMLAEAVDGKFDLRASNNWQDTSAPTVVISGLKLRDQINKDHLDPADRLRSALHIGEYRLHSEASVLEQKKKLREERDRRKIFQMLFEVGYSKQAPVVPVNKRPIHEMLKIARGIQLISHWGQTICNLPKVAHRRVTYESLANESKTDSETKSYLNWVVSSNMKSAKLDDLKGYLQAIKYRSAGEGIVNYPGTNSMREFGS
eukprot:s637_g39.t1